MINSDKDKNGCFEEFWHPMKKNFLSKNVLIFFLILIMGILPRVWNFGAVPAGLHQDEVANGVDAYNILHYRMDRTGIHNPIQFISWGSGQSALYGYLSIPFIYLWGLTQTTLRLPNLIVGILTLPLVFLAGRKILNIRFGIISMFMVAISPWSIMSSRWGLEAYFVVFIFMCGFCCFLYTEKTNFWFVAGSIFFAISLYAYGTTFAVVPIFIAASVFLMWKMGKLNWRTFILGAIAFLLTALPMILFVIINAFDLDPIDLLKFSIPRLPTAPRYITTVSVFQANAWVTIFGNIQKLIELLWSQKDGIIFNSVEPYGFLYPLASVIAAIGTVLSMVDASKRKTFSLLMVSFWLIASLSIGLFQPANIHRLSLVYIPMTFAMGYLIYRVFIYSPKIFFIVTAIYFILFTGFLYRYFGDTRYLEQSNRSVNFGILDALNYTKQFPDYDVCISESIHESSIYLLLLDKPHPTTYLKTVGYIDGDIPFRKPGVYSRYSFRIDECNLTSTNLILILRDDEAIPAILPMKSPVRFHTLLVYVK